MWFSVFNVSSLLELDVFLLGQLVFLWLDSSLKYALVPFTPSLFQGCIERMKRILLNPVRVRGWLYWSHRKLPMDFGQPARYLSGRYLIVCSVFRYVIHCQWRRFAFADCLVSVAYSLVFLRMLLIHLPVNFLATWSGPCTAAPFTWWYMM